MAIGAATRQSVEPSHWRIASPTRPTILDWDGDFVVYNPLSGSTHILEIDSGEVLGVFTEGPADVAAVRAHLARVLQVPGDDRLEAHVGEILGRLEDVGLIEPVD